MAWATVPGTGNLLMSSGDTLKVGATQTQTLTSFSVGSTVTVDGMLDVGGSGKGGQGDITNTGMGLFGSLVKVEDSAGVNMGFSLSATNSGARDFRWLQKANDRWAFTDEDDAAVLIQMDRTVPDIEFQRAIGGMVVGMPTGGSQGAGTINAEEVNDDGSTLCAPIEEYLTGKPANRKKWDNIAPSGRNRAFDIFSQIKSEGYDGSLTGFQSLIQGGRSVPGLPNLKELQKRNPQTSHHRQEKISLTEKVERLWLAVDILGVTLDQMITRNRELESKVSSLESLVNNK